MALATRVRLVLATLSLLVVSTPALDNGLGKTPPMGFNTWNHFGCVDTSHCVASRRGAA
jgi:alpha-galactosidase